MSGDAMAVMLIALLFAMPLAVLAAGGTLLQAGRSARTPLAEPVFAAVERSKFLDPVEVKVALTWGAGAALPAPAWDGLITEVAVEAGDKISPGSRILRIDGIWRVAAPSAAPFYAPVSAFSSAGETRELNAVLRALQYDVPGDDWTWNTLVAVRDLAAALGVPDALALDAFDPSWVLWTPTPDAIVGSVAVAAGHPAPAMGEDVVVGPARMRTISVTPNEGSTLPEVEDGDEWVIRIGDVSVPYTAELTASAPEMAPLAAALGGSQPVEVDGLVQRTQPVDGWQVPISAVHTDVRGTVCVFRGTREGLDPVPVTVERGTIGTARVSGALSARDRVLVNAGEIAPGRPCD